MCPPRFRNRRHAHAPLPVPPGIGKIGIIFERLRGFRTYRTTYRRIHCCIDLIVTMLCAEELTDGGIDDGDGSAAFKSPIRRLGSTRKILYFNNIRLQLNEHLRCLDSRVEAQVSLVSELQDYFRKRAEVEMDYSKSLDKLAKSLQMRHKEQKPKREQWSLFTSYSCWQQLVLQTKNLSKDHGALGELYSTHLVSRLSQVTEDVQRIYKRCREICYELHEEILRVLHELHTTMKTYQSYQSEAKQAEAKLKVAENQRLKIEQSVPKEKLEKSKKVRLIGKEVQKRKNKYFDAKLKALKARNEYLLCLEATNSTVQKYFLDDLSDLIDCMDFGFHHCVSKAMKMQTSAEEGRVRSMQAGLDATNLVVSAMDSGVDKQRFLEFNHTAFMIPKKFEFQGQKDEYAEPELQKLLCADMETRLEQLKQRVNSLHTETEEVWKTLATAEQTLLEMLTANDYDCSSYFGEKAIPTSKPPETVSIKLRADKHETEEFYMTKLRDYLMRTSRIYRLDVKQQHIETLMHVCCAETEQQTKQQTPQRPLHKPMVRRKRIGRLQMNGQPKLFGGSLEEYLDATNQEIPLIVKSCVRVINLYGLHHQGIFRVSGSQVEINNFKDAFERGEDPLADTTDASDINSVAGVLKLYLRELREPLFPIVYFEQFMELAREKTLRRFAKFYSIKRQNRSNRMARTKIALVSRTTTRRVGHPRRIPSLTTRLFYAHTRILVNCPFICLLFGLSTIVFTTAPPVSSLLTVRPNHLGLSSLISSTSLFNPVPLLHSSF